MHGDLRCKPVTPEAAFASGIDCAVITTNHRPSTTPTS